MADTPANNLSGGEKSRLLLGLATFEGPHLVVLDEPTNHLDIDSRAALIEAINAYPGAVILVSHDRFLLETCADRLWLVANGEVRPFDGDFDDYRRLVLGANAAATPGALSGRDRAPGEGREGARASRAGQRRAAAERRSELAPLRRQIDALDKTIASLTRRIAEIDGALADPKLYDRDPARVAILGKERAQAAGALAAAEDRWLALSGDYESAMAQA
jgi:ATP-binding cassette, subfamily F, member 3